MKALMKGNFYPPLKRAEGESDSVFPGENRSKHAHKFYAKEIMALFLKH